MRSALLAGRLALGVLVVAACSGDAGEEGFDDQGGSSGRAGQSGSSGKAGASGGQAAGGAAGSGGGAGAAGGQAGSAQSGAAGASGGSGGGSAGAGGGGTKPACEGKGPSGAALGFDGVDDQVSMGEAPALGLKQFTVEAWVRRDGAGKAAGTGVGGLSLVPIAGKGRGENDGGTADCNYAVGFFGDVLGADFEDLEAGKNHPVVGSTYINWGAWHHVAATFDGKAWRLYVDGKLDAHEPAAATPRHDSAQHFGVGTALNTKGEAAGRLHGAVDELRVWNRALGEAEIAAGMYTTGPKGEGLVGRWAFDASGAADSVGGNDGAIKGATPLAGGAPLDGGLPPSVSAPSPAPDTSVTGASVELQVQVADADSQAFSAVFYARELTPADDFTVVVLPDTQYYTLEGKNQEKYFYDQTKWVIQQRKAYNIAAVIHNGDLVNNGSKYPYQWKVADKAIRTLEDPLPDLPDGLPYGIAVGNHDQDSVTAYGETTTWNKYFGLSRYEGRSYYGGHYGSKNDEHWFTFSASGLDFLVMNLQFTEKASPEPAVLDWARNVFQSHPGSFGILNTHTLINAKAAWGSAGKATYEALRPYPNLKLMTCGHIPGESRRTDEHEGNKVHTMLADYQARENGGSGWMRIWEFSPANRELTVRTYSPTLDKWETDDNSEFTLPVDLSGAGAAFGEVASVDPAQGSPKAVLSGLKPGRVYEWFARVSDCVHTADSPVYRFTTAP